MLIPLALEEHFETDQRVNLENADAINSAVVRPPCYSDVLEPRLA